MSHAARSKRNEDNMRDNLQKNYGSIAGQSPAKLKKYFKTGQQFFNKRHGSTSSAFNEEYSPSPNKIDANYGMAIP